MWRNGPIALGYCGASGAEAQAMRKAIAGSSGCSHSGTPVVSADDSIIFVQRRDNGSELDDPSQVPACVFSPVIRYPVRVLRHMRLSAG
jgi:hypothetical protein